MKEHSTFDFAKRPFLVIWETTHACDLACLHCRAEADPTPRAGELMHEEALKLIHDVKEMGTPIIVFSGGDPLKRVDLSELIRYAQSLGLRTGAIPAVTPALTKEKIKELKEAGLVQIAFSLDAARAEEHDAFRRVSGVFDRTLQSIKWANELELHTQINSLVNVHNMNTFNELIELVRTLPIVFWEIFFLVPTGRGKELPLLSAEKFEEAFE
ncbi:MAG: radical SAM protein, partial [Candidatus Omnitrophica bacterium]|nr:radical SAM protein [Candidatus Omnitrophota bacterium]